MPELHKATRLYIQKSVCKDCLVDLAIAAQRMEGELLEVEQAEETEATDPGRAARTRTRKPLVCKETEGQLKAQTQNLEFYMKAIWIVAGMDVLFIVATFIVLIQFTLGDAPKSDVNRVVFIIPIAGTVLSSGAVAFLINERRLARNAVANLNKTFQRVCKGV